MNILDLKRKALGWAARGTGDGTNGAGDGTNNGGNSNSGPTGGNYGGGNGGGLGKSGTSTSNYGSRQGFSGATSYGGGVNGGNGGSLGDGSDSNSGKGSTSSQTATQTPREAVARDSIMGITDPDAKDAPTEADPESKAPKTATETLADQVRASITEPDLPGLKVSNPSFAPGYSIAPTNVTAPGLTAPDPDRQTGLGLKSGTPDTSSKVSQPSQYGLTQPYSYQDVQTLQSLGLGAREGTNPNNPTQTVDQVMASKTAHDALNATVPAAASIMMNIANPAFGLLMNTAKAAQAGKLGQFAGSVAGNALAGALGLPGFSGMFSETGRALAAGETPNLGKAATGTVAGMVGSKVGQEVGQSLGPIAGTVAGRLAGSATQFGAGKAFGS